MPSQWIQAAPKLGSLFAIQWDGTQAALNQLRAAGMSFRLDDSVVGQSTLIVKNSDGTELAVQQGNFLIRTLEGRHRSFNSTDFAAAFTPGLPVNPTDPGGPGSH